MLYDGIGNSLKIRVQNQFLVPLVQKRMGRIGEEPFQVDQQHRPFPAIAPVMAVKLFLQSPVMPVKALVLLACSIFIDHARAIQGNQNFIAKGFVNLSVSDMGCINGPNLPTLAQSKVGTFHGFPRLIQNLPPPVGCSRKQVVFKVLNTLLPSYPVTAFLSIEEHLPVRKYFVHRPKGITPGLFFRLPLGFAALVSRFMPFLACHKNKCSPFVQINCRVPSNLLCPDT